MASKETNQNSLNIFAFWKAQQPAWKTTVYRTSMERLGYKAVLPYLSLYIVLMGATKAQIGYVTSLGMIVSALMAPILGQHIDRHGPKKMYIFGILVLLGGYIALWGAPVWQVAALGMFLHTMGSTLGGQSCSNICGNCLASCDRAKGMLVCETFAAGALGMIGPAFAGWFLVNIMKVPEGTAPTDPASIKPLFLFCVILTVLTLLLVIFKLDVSHLGGAKRVKRNAFKDAVAMMKADKNCAKWIIMQGVNRMPTAMIIPYLQLYAAEVKGASTEELAIMTTCTALTALTCGYFVGIMADKYGRKIVLGSTISLYVAGLVLLLMTKSTAMLYIVGILAGFQEISMVVSGSVQNELVPHWALGRWAGANGMIGSLIAAAVAAAAGIIYDTIGPQWLFIIYIVSELVIRLPLLVSLPETLTYKVNEENFQTLLENA